MENETVPCEPGQESDHINLASVIVQDPAPTKRTERARKSMPKIVKLPFGTSKFDLVRCVKLTGLPTSLFVESLDNFTDAVVEILFKTFGIQNDSVEKVVRFPLKAEEVDQESAVQAMVTFVSRVHKHRVFTQRSKLDTPMTVEQLDEWPKELKQDDEITNDEYFVSDEIGEEMRSFGDPTKLDEELAEDVEESKIDQVDETDGPFDKIEDNDTNEEGKKNTRFESPLDWNGAPEFQWKATIQADERNKLVLDNVSIGDFENPWLYQTIQRAKHIDFNCINTTFKGSFDHNPLRKGRLTLTFQSDCQAMSQAINGLVCLRTRPNKRIKIYLPQTNGTVTMKTQLENKLGRVVESNEKSRKLLLRGIGDDVTEEEVLNKLAIRPDDVRKVQICNDVMNRRCAVVTFFQPEIAIRTHMNRDEVRLGDKRKSWVRVFYMQDVVPISLLTKFEAKFVPKQPPKKVDENEGKKQVESETAGDKGEEKLDNKEMGGNETERKTKDDEQEVQKDEKIEPTGDKEDRKRPRSKSPNRIRKKARPAVPRTIAAAIKISTRMRTCRFSGSGTRGGLVRGGGGGMRGNPRGAIAARGPWRSPRGGEFRASPRSGVKASYSNRGNRGSYNSPVNFPFRANPWANGGPRGGISHIGDGYNRERNMDNVIREQREQLAMQQQMLQQHQVINNLASELRKQRNSASAGFGSFGSGYGSSSSSRGGYDNSGGRTSYAEMGPGGSRQMAMNQMPNFQTTYDNARGYRYGKSNSNRQFGSMFQQDYGNAWKR